MQTRIAEFRRLRRLRRHSKTTITMPQMSVYSRSDSAAAAPQVSPLRLVAIDLDGTLLDRDKKVSDQTVRALRCLPGAGVKVVIASARPPRSVRHIYAQLGLDTWQINYNGALIWDEPNRQTIFH